MKGTLEPISESERSYSTDAGVVISEVRISLVCENSQVYDVTGIIRSVGRIGQSVSGWVYVSAIGQALPIGGSSN